MKFLVSGSCDITKAYDDFGIHCDCFDLKITAPSARIAEYKVMSRYSSVQWCEVKCLRKEKQENRRDLRKLCLCYLFITAPTFYLLGFSQTQIDLPLRTIAAALSPAVIAPFLALAVLVIEGDKNRERERISALERECFRRMGYKKAWADRERGANAEFIEWEKEELSERWPE